MITKENKYMPQIVFHPGETLSEKLEEMNMVDIPVICTQ